MIMECTILFLDSLLQFFLLPLSHLSLHGRITCAIMIPKMTLSKLLLAACFSSFSSYFSEIFLEDVLGNASLSNSKRGGTNYLAAGSCFLPDCHCASVFLCQEFLRALDSIASILLTDLFISTKSSLSVFNLYLQKGIIFVTPNRKFAFNKKEIIAQAKPPAL